MAKGDDAIRKKKNKSNRKKLNNESSTVSARVAGIIASKKRRKSGKRRMCEGMCFSLPTPDDPFNERLGKVDFKKKEMKKRVPSRADERVSHKDKTSAKRKEIQVRNHVKPNNQEPKEERVIDFESNSENADRIFDTPGWRNLVEPEKAKLQLSGKGGLVHDLQGQSVESSSCPSKFLILCLNSIRDALLQDGVLDSEEDRPFFVSTWGVEFWKCYSVGRDLLETSGSCSTVEQIAWIVSSAADAIVRKEKEGLSFSSPFLLYLVPSQEKASKVRSICKPLKALGIHTVSLHPGAPLDHQIHGLKSCEPEFLVSTPQRLLELVSLKAVDISRVSLLVVDELEAICKGGHLDATKSIRQSISGSHIAMVLNNDLSFAAVPAVQGLLTGSICRLSLNDSITSQSAYIFQSVHVCASKEKKFLKVVQVLRQAFDNHFSPQLMKVLCVSKESKIHQLAAAIKSGGYSVSTDSSICSGTDIENRKVRPAVSVIGVEQITTTDLGEYGFVIYLDFAPSIDNYVHILKRMARHTVNGVLHSIINGEDAPFAGELIQILKQCGQIVPDALRNLCPVSPMLEH